VRERAVTRASGINVPLFSIPTTRSWGIGEFYDLVDFARWAAGAGQSVVQILPVMELPMSEPSPYSALTSFALDPAYIAIPRVPDFSGTNHLPPPLREKLGALRSATRVPYATVRALKEFCLRDAWSTFRHTEMARESKRALAFEAFCAREGWWLDEYALFRTALDRQGQRAWWEWPEALRHARLDALDRVRKEFDLEIGFRKYVQWLADEQWVDARRQIAPVRVFGDLPFTIGGNSAEVWLRQAEFRIDATVGAPPDAFSAEGQDWGLPPWRWRVMRQRDYSWFRARARRYAALFDGYRIDHLVGLYRTWIWPAYEAQPPFFDPPDEREQLARGEELIRIFKSAGAELIAEDLGTVPLFVRQSITSLGVPGFKVLHWERHWERPGQPLIDPRTFPPLSVATTGTHDLDPLAATLTSDEVRQEVESLIASGSGLSLVPLQDAFAWKDRINTPSQVDETNWTWQVPCPVDQWRTWPDAEQRQQWLRELSLMAGRA
jgi:4-alpha-glucanotransferase